MAQDGGVPDGGLLSLPTAPATILQTGSTGNLLLRGVVLTPTGVLSPGEVLVAGEYIVCVAADCTTASEAAQATWIDTKGIISPGLIDSHNHMSYNFLPEWVPNPHTFFDNRYIWADLIPYENHIEPYSSNRSSNDHFCPASKWGELRSLVHGTTTIQGQPSASGSCINWGIRNANKYHGLGYDHMRPYIASPRDINDDYAQGLVSDFTRETEPVTRFHVHMAEGVKGDHIDEEFDSFAGRDPRINRHNGTSLLNSTSILIHCVTITDSQLQEAKAANAKIVWSPSSNIALYGPGNTAPIQRILELGITTGLGPDWTPSGEDEMLSEMRFAWSYGLSRGITALTPKKMWEMATADGAEVVGLQNHIGKLEVGMRADITVFGRSGDNPYYSVMDSRAENVRLVLLNGEGHYGDAYLKAATARSQQDCEAFSACGTDKYICVKDSTSSVAYHDRPLNDIRSRLYNILEYCGPDGGIPDGGCFDGGIRRRGHELLELVNCDN